MSATKHCRLRERNGYLSMNIKIILVSILFILVCAGCGQQPEEVENQTPTESSDMGVEYSYWLRLDNSKEYMEEYDGLTIQVRDYDNYLDVVVTNHGTETKTFGGEYGVYRNENGEYSEIPDDMNLIHGGVHVQDMERLQAYDITNDTANETEIEINPEDNRITIEPGQKIRIKFLTMIYRIFDSPEYEGDYRLIYGDMSIDFSLIIDIVC